MRLIAFGLNGYGPIQNLSVDDLADIVVLAGPNGVGKTNINNAILQLAREPRHLQNQWMVVQATDDQERAAWGKDQLDTRINEDATKLTKHLRRSQTRNQYYSSFLNFDSDRAVRNVQPMQFTWDIKNPLVETVGWDLSLSQLSSRYNDVRHSLFRLVETQRREIADKVIRVRDEGAKEMSVDFPDLLQPFKEAFWQLLAPKKLVDVNVQDQTIYFELDGKRLSIEALSSGEKEVVNIVFDFLLRKPSHCIVIFDEPELHLHPELSYKLLQTLSRIGNQNQFIFSTHSPEIISASLENTVVFVRPPSGPDQNQAIIVHRDDETHNALQTLGQSIGIISLGKKIILVEGEESSLDKQTYGAILKSRFPEFVLVPVGGKEAIRSFETVRTNVLNKTIWGVDFFLLADRDAAYSLGRRAVRADTSARVKELPRYHLENYFLDATVLSKAFASMEPESSWLRDPVAIEKKLREIAVASVPYAVALNVNAMLREKIGNVSLMPKGLDGSQGPDELVELIKNRALAERERFTTGLDVVEIEKITRLEFERLKADVEGSGNDWRTDLPGRQILNKFAAAANIQPGRLKQLYLGASDGNQTFADIVAIFEGFRVPLGDR